MEFELRFVPTSLETQDDKLVVEGLVNKTESWSHVLGAKKKFREKISKGAFGKAIQNETRIDFLSEHDTGKILATTENSSLSLWEDDEGLKMRAEICPTSYGKDTFELMKSNIINHMSFGFRAISDKWKKLANGTHERVIQELELFEVSAVRNPAYPQSAIAARGINIVEDVDIPDDVEEIQEERNLNMDKDKVQEQRAYACSLWGKTDVVNSAMNIVAECSSLSGYLMRYVGEDKDTATTLVALQHTITMANKIINDEIQVLVDDFKAMDADIKASEAAMNQVDEVVSDDVSIRSQEEIVQNVETEVITEAIIQESTGEIVAEVTTEVTTEIINETEVVTETVVTDEDENRSFDISSYKARLKNII